MTRLKKINYLRRLPWIWLEHLSSPAAAEGSLEAASTFSSAAAEAEASWTWPAFFFLSFGWEMQHIHGGRAVILLQGAGNYVAFIKGGHDLGVFTALHQCHLAPGVVSLGRTDILGNTCWKGSAWLACKGSKRPLWKVQVPLSSLCLQLF